MTYFFRKNGQVSMGRLTIATLSIFGLYSNAFICSVKQVKDPGMDPIFQATSQVFDSTKAKTVPSLRERLLAFLMADKLLFSKVKALPNEQSEL